VVCGLSSLDQYLTKASGKRAPRRVMREEVLRAWRDEQGNADLEMVERRLKAIDDQEP
jgi:hypothetical protein